jgi:type II secretory pathway predicted ATPase ExeA
MIRAHFGLAKDPFSSEKLSLLPQQREVLDTLRVHCQQGGFCVIVGEPGTGKTVVKQALCQYEPKRLIVPVVNRTLHTYHSTLRILCEAFQIETDGVDVRCERRLIEEARRLNAAGKMLAPVIDDAHLMDVAALRKIRLLFEDFPKNHCLVLIAQPELLSRLSLTVNEDIKSRVTYSVLLQKLAPDTLADFIKSELDKVALAHSTFTDDALSLIVRSAEGGLRRAKNLCLAALLDAVRDRTKTVDLKHVNRVLLQPHWRHYEAAFPEGASGILEGRNGAKGAAMAVGGAP